MTLPRIRLGLACMLCASAPFAVMAQPLPDIPFQTLTLDPSHASVTATINHLGFSNYTFGFDTLSATLDIPSPPPGFLSELLGPDWLDSVAHPTITFTSDAIEITGERTANVTGEMRMLGATAPVILSVTFNDGYASAPWEPHARLGFSATTSFARSAFGMAFGLPAPGTTLGVGDRIDVAIEAEFTGTPAPD